MALSQRSMGIIAGSFLGLVVVGLVAMLFGRWLQGGDVEDVAERLPEDTILLVSFRGFADLYLEFEDELESASGKRDAEDGIEKFDELFGFDPTDRDSLEDTGFSFTSPWGMAALGDPKRLHLDLVYLIPVDDEDKATDFLEDLADSLELETDEDEVEDLDAVVVEEGLAWLIDGDYLIACVPVNRKDGMDREERSDAALDCLEDIIGMDPDESLAESETFERALGLADPEWKLLYYSPTEWLSDALKLDGDPPDEVVDLVEDVVERWPASISTVSIERSQVRVQSINLIDSDYAHLFTMDGSDTLAEVIPGEPIGVARTSMQLHATWGVLMESDLMGDEAEEVIDQAEDALGIDIEEDLIANLSGHFSLVVLEADRSGGVPVDLVFHASVEDEELALETVEDLADAIEDMGTEMDEESAGDAIWYVTEEGTEFCIGLAEEHLVLAGGHGRCEITFEGIEDGGSTYLEELPGSVEDGLESGPSSYAYLAVDRLVSLIKDEENLSSEEDALLDVLEELILSAEGRAWTEPDHSTYELIITPPEGDFGPGLEALADTVVELIWEEM